MEPFVSVRGIAAALPLPNLDTDQIMPKQFLRGIDRKGLSRGALYALRFDESGVLRPNFVLNQSPWDKACFLVVGPNFGCGSSREHAVWGLRELGIRAILGTSFGGIFSDNCFRNGVPALSLPQEDLDRISKLIADPLSCDIQVDLSTQTVLTYSDGISIHVEMDAWQRDMLIQGLDSVGMTLSHAQEIRDFEDRYLEKF